MKLAYQSNPDNYRDEHTRARVKIALVIKVLLNYKHMKNLFIISILLSIGFYFCPSVHAQSAVLTAGGDAIGTNGSCNFAIGELCFGSASDLDGSINMGVIQDYTISISTDFITPEQSDVEINAFPNPTSNLLTLSVGESDLNNLYYTLFDALGNIVDGKQITTVQSFVDMSKYPFGCYILKIYNHSKHIKTLKIIKK